MATVAELKKERARLEKELQAEVSWGSAATEDVMKPAYRLLTEALATTPVDAAKIAQARATLALLAN
jgi:hypothetical protein